MSKRWGRALAGLVTGLTATQRKWRRANTRLLVANALFPTDEVATRHGPIAFVTTHPEALQYPRELLSREPETVAWIDSFAAPCTFWDVGANVGAYALYAAARPGVNVTAFEPSAASYAALCRNIEANRHGPELAAYCVALGESTRLGALNMATTNPGNSFNLFETTENCFGRAIAVRFAQPALGFAIDDFRRLFGLPAPNYLKIDVDGTEAQILDGGAMTLRDPALRSVLIELEQQDTERNAAIVGRLEQAGFALAQRGAAQAGSANAIFTRGDTSRACAARSAPQRA